MASRRQVLYVNSARRHTGTSSDFKVILGNGVLHAPRGSRTSIAVGEATINRSWLNVKQGANWMEIDGVPVQIPEGNYNALDLRVALSAALPVGWSVTYNRLTAKFTFTRPTNSVPGYLVAFRFIGPLLGFGPATLVVLTSENPQATSTRPARVNGENAILIHSDLTKASGGVLDNLTAVDSFVDSTVIAKVPIDVPPYDNIVFRVQNDLEFFDVQQGHTDAMRIWLTDENDVPVDLQYDWTTTLVVSHEPEQSTELLETVQEARDLLKLMALSKKNILR